MHALTLYCSMVVGVRNQVFYDIPKTYLKIYVNIISSLVSRGVSPKIHDVTVASVASWLADLSPRILILLGLP